MSARCVTVNVDPPITMVPVRVVPVAFAATLYDTIPWLGTALVMVIQATDDVAVQVQPGPVVTEIDPVVAYAFVEREIGLSATAQAVVPVCVTITVRPATRMEPVRGPLLVLADDENVTEPLPVPDEPGNSVSQLALLADDQLHPVPAVTLAVVVSPADPIETESGDTL